jgi:hypothetical protein
MPAHCKPEATYVDMHSLAQRLRGKALLLMDADTDFACDLICASFLLDDLRVGQRRFYDEIAPLQRNS